MADCMSWFYDEEVATAQTQEEIEQICKAQAQRVNWIRHRFRRWWLPEGYWRQKRREFVCWVKHGHKWHSFGGAAGWSVDQCDLCGADRVGPGNFFSTSYNKQS